MDEWSERVDRTIEVLERHQANVGNLCGRAAQHDVESRLGEALLDVCGRFADKARDGRIVGQLGRKLMAGAGISSHRPKQSLPVSRGSVVRSARHVPALM